MSLSRRHVLKMGAALAAVPLLGADGNGREGKRFLTGSEELDAALGGGIREGRVVVVAGPRGSGKTAFMMRMARANGVADVHVNGSGTSDMLSIMGREDGSYVGALMVDAVEPATEREREEMARDAGAREAFLRRWLERTREVTRQSGGLFVISICHEAKGGWMETPDYVIGVQGTASTVLRRA